ncbi:hypothetical protein [Aeromicrobium sp. Leaf350]|uniref:hypothetical protein n=1 Tax=Aeromicrobium sp. Leaf350 TaxID=2876565 RepID=UPI001E58ECC5|nr:hypothetical protein [Aeromicrobium sp. Leaf350]
MTEPADDLSEAVVLHLKRYPSSNDEEFLARFSSAATREAVRAILDETMHVRVEWGQKSLAEIGDEVRDAMRDRHPELSHTALHQLGNYYTYLVK